MTLPDEHGNTSSAQNLDNSGRPAASGPDDDAAGRIPARLLLILASPLLHPFHDPPPPYQPRVLGWDELRAAVRSAPPSAAILLHPLDGGTPDPRVRELIAAAPLLPVVAVLPFRDAAALRELAEWGVSELADPALEGTPAALAAVLHRAHAAPFTRRIEAALPRWLGMNALTLLRAAACVAVDHGGAMELAAAFDSSERNVVGWCAREGLPAPRRLLAWLRALLAAALLEEPQRSLLNAARSAGYAAGHPLRRALRELLPTHLANSPRAVRFGELMTAFNDELLELREISRKLRLRQHSA